MMMMMMMMMMIMIMMSDTVAEINVLLICLSANFPDNVVEKLPEDFDAGIYYGWASVDGGIVHRMVMSIGWNPFYHNSKKTMVRFTSIFDI